MSQENDRWVNWQEAGHYMNNIQDPVIRNLLGLVYDKVLRNEIDGPKPTLPFDLLYCFQTLHGAFSCYEELHVALKGGNPDPSPPDWI
jgi:hypothetical protein